MLQQRHFDSGATIFAEADPADAIYGVIAGRVHVTAMRAANKPVFLLVVGPGGVIGAISALDGLARGVSAIAATPVAAYRLSRDSLLRLIVAEPQVSRGLFGVICREHRLATTRIVYEYSQANIPARLAARILAMTADNGKATRPARGLDITQEDLAKFVCVSRQVVNMYLNEWARFGWISTSRNRLEVRERDALIEIANNLVAGSGQCNDAA